MKRTDLDSCTAEYVIYKHSLIGSDAVNKQLVLRLWSALKPLSKAGCGGHLLYIAK